MKLIVTGCARSGTTVMVHLLRYFYSTHVVIEDEAHPLDFTNYNHKDHVLVIKKPFLEPHHIEYFTLGELIEKGWKVMWMLRDGRDVITSTANVVPPSRWIHANEQYLMHYNDPSVLLLRYDKLITDTENQMKRIEKFIDQKYQDDYHLFYKSMNPSDPMNYGIDPKPLYADAIGRYKNHNIDTAMSEPKFTHLLNLFGYEM